MGSSCVIARRGRQAPDPGRRPRSSLAVLYPIVCGVPCDSRRAALVFFRLWKGLDQTERKSSPISHRMHTERAEVRKCGTRSCSPLSSLEFGMHVNIIEHGGTVVPTLRYRDVAAAIDWLCNAFGFEKHLVVSGDSGAVRYAELTFGNGMIMLGPVEDSGLDRFMTRPRRIPAARRRRSAISSLPMPSPTATEPRQPAPRSCSTSRMRTATGADTPAATSKGTFGISGPTTRGSGVLRLPAGRAGIQPCAEGCDGWPSRPG